jgi:GNAT superfamily N-acetyltransferase
MDIVYRKSTQQDFIAIDRLLKTCFGDRFKYGALDNLDDRYLLAFHNNRLIGITGLTVNSPLFNGAEIDWTCLLPEYRGYGIIVNMISQVIEGCSQDIYCSCLRLHNSDKINLHHSMEALGFQCIVKNHKTFNSKYHPACNDCIYKSDVKCVCYEDLYLRKALNDQ